MPNSSLQVFLIDDSQSMLRHWVDVTQTVEAIGYVVKDVDPDGMELRFTSQPTEPHKCKNSKELLEKLSLHKPRDGTECMMENSLSCLIDHLVPPSSSPTKPKSAIRTLGLSFLNRSSNANKTGISVYVLTNAIWTASTHSGMAVGEGSGSGSKVNTCGVDKTIHTLVERLRAGKHSRGFATLQFIRFGHDKLGKQRLRHLDNDIKEAKEWDIVDRRYYGRSVRPILIGALNEESYPSDDSEDEDSV